MKLLLKTEILIFLLSGLSAISAEDICGYSSDATLTISVSEKENISFSTGVAETPEKHEKGLMNCNPLKKGTGLFFIFEDDAPRYFWMKNTPAELAIIFIDSNFKVVSVRKGTPFSEATIPSIYPARYVLEINWNESSRIKPGQKVSFKMK